MFQIDTQREKCYKEVKYYCERFEYLKAYELLIKGIDVKCINNISEMKHYLHQLGITTLLGKKEIYKAIIIFEKLLNLGYDEKSLFIDALTINSLGIAYYLSGYIKIAKKYFEKSITKLETLELINPDDMNKLLLTTYNTAKFHSDTGDFKLAILICKTGINLAIEENRMAHLDKLYYEKAFNHLELGDTELAKIDFERAYTLADIRQSQIIKKAATEKLNEIKGQKKGISIKLLTTNKRKIVKLPNIKGL